jgi:hypothetical protein
MTPPAIRDPSSATPRPRTARCLGNPDNDRGAPAMTTTLTNRVRAILRAVRAGHRPSWRRPPPGPGFRQEVLHRPHRGGAPVRRAWADHRVPSRRIAAPSTQQRSRCSALTEGETR